MNMNEYGKKSQPVILMLHPMGITAKKLYEIIGSKFKGEYHLLIPDMGNHGSETKDFISAEEEAKSIYQYLVEQNIKDIHLIYGASMGAVVALNMMKYSDIKVRSMYLDGAPIAKLGFMMAKLFGPVLVWQKSIYEKNDTKNLKEFIERWGEDINTHMAECFKNFSKESIYNIAKSCVMGCAYSIPKELQANTYMEWGKDEEFAKKSPSLVREKYPLAHVMIREGYNHCEYMMKENKRYVEFVEQLAR